MKKFFIVPHSHLDREWYRTFQENRVKLTRFMDDLLDTLDEDPDYTCYTLDAQTSFIDDYFDVKPQNEKRFATYVKEGKLPIGPWYVQPDEHLPTAEGIIRNMLISKKISDHYADYNRVGYVPDSFGQSSTMPTLLNGFGVDSAVIYRGFAEEDSKYNDFIWEGLDGSKIVANWMPIGYGNAMFLKEDLASNIKVIEENIELLEDRSISNNYLLMCGSDQSFVKKFLPKAIKDLNEYYKDKDYEFVLATPQDYIDAIRPYMDKMDVIRGELRKGKRSRTHNSIGATRMDIKQKNFEVEMKYLKQLEPLSVFANMIGLENDEELINRGWKYIVENHAHDSICCCCTDAIHKEIISRMIYAEQLANYLIKEKLEQLQERICFSKNKGRPILLFSSCLGKREGIIELDVYVKNKDFKIYDADNNELEHEVLSCEPFNLKDTKVSFTPIPDDFYDKMHIRLKCSSDSFGYQTVYIKEGQISERIKNSMVQENALDNGLVRVLVKEDGSLEVLDKTNGKVYKNLNVFVDDGNAGDEYDYSPSFNDYAIQSLNNLKQVTCIEDSNLQATLCCEYELMIPETTDNEGRSEKALSCVIKSFITLKKDDPVVYFHTEIENQSKNHRIQVYFEADEHLTSNFADIQLGEIIRENNFALTKASEVEGWHERYYPVFNSHKYSGLRDTAGTGFILMNKGLPQYEIYNEENKNTVLALTLLSCVGYMGNVNLKYRPGRRSGSTDATPDSQMLGKFACDYAFLSIDKTVNYKILAENYVNPIYGVAMPEFNSDGNLPDCLDLITSNNDIFVSALKLAEDHKGYILRLLNPDHKPLTNAEVQINRYYIDSIEQTDLAERSIESNKMHVIKLNNPDGSAKAIMSGKVVIDSMNQNELLTLRLK